MYSLIMMMASMPLGGVTVTRTETYTVSASCAGSVSTGCAGVHAHPFRDWLRNRPRLFGSGCTGSTTAITIRSVGCGGGSATYRLVPIQPAVKMPEPKKK